MTRTDKAIVTGWANCAHPAHPLPVLLAPVLVAVALTVIAARPALGSDEETAAMVVAAPESTISLEGLLGGEAAVSDTDLESQRARAMIEVDRVVINDQNLTGVVSDNSAINTVSGNNTIGDSAFSAASGFVSSIQNTGNNVLIQSATIVNITVEP